MGNGFAYLTLVDDFFVPGAIALRRSLRRFTDIPLVALCLPMQNKGLLQAEGIECRDILPIENPNTGAKERFQSTYSKLWAFAQTQYQRVVFLDADILVLQPIDDLFERTGFAAAPDIGYAQNDHMFNTGVFSVQPSRELFEQMMEQAKVVVAPDGSDQGFLNEFLKGNWQRLDPVYNTLKRRYLVDRENFNLTKIKVLHFVGEKPWNIASQDQESYRELYELWAQFCEPEIVQNTFVEYARGELQSNAGELKLRAQLLKEQSQEIRRLERLNEQKQQRIAELTEQSLELREELRRLERANQKKDELQTLKKEQLQEASSTIRRLESWKLTKEESLRQKNEQLKQITAENRRLQKSCDKRGEIVAKKNQQIEQLTARLTQLGQVS